MLAAVMLAVAGCACLSLAMDRHRRQACPERPRAGRGLRLGLRALGGILLTVSLLACVQQMNSAVGVTAWFGSLTVGACTVATALSYLPCAIPRLAATAVTIAACDAAWSVLRGGSVG